MTWERVLTALLILALVVHLIQMRRRHLLEQDRDRKISRVLRHLDVWAETWGQPADVVSERLRRIGNNGHGKKVRG